MRRKSQPAPEPVPEAPAEASPDVIEGAKKLAEREADPDPVRAMARCEVCGGDATPNPSEQLCWVCRRLKISAWRDIDQQMPAPE